MKSYILIGILLTALGVMLIVGCDSITAPGIGDSPYNLSLNKISEDQLEISWQYAKTVDDTIHFEISRRVGEENWDNSYYLIENEQQWFIDNIQTDTHDVYAYRVRATSIVTDETTPFSETVAYFSEQTTPTDLSITQINQDEVQVSWEDNANGEDGYYVDKKVGEAEWEKRYKKLPSNSDNFIDPVDLFETIHYRVYAYAGVSQSAYSDTTSMTPTLTAPSDLTLQKPDPNKIRLNWQDNSEGEEGFAIDKKVGKQDWIIEYALVDSNSTTWLDNITEHCGTFTYRVRAFYGEFYSAYSNEAQTNVRLEVIGSHTTPGVASDIFVANWHAYIADYYDGLSVINSMNPSNPSQTGSLDIVDRTIAVFVQDNFAYVASHGGMNNPGALSIVDITNPSDPVIMGTTNTIDIPKDIHIYGDYAYVADSESGLSIMYVATSVPSYITTIGSGGNARNVFVHQEKAYVANGLDGVGVIDIYDPDNPVFVEQFSSSGLSNDVYVKDNHLFVADGEQGLKIINLTTRNTQYVQTDGFAYDVHVDDDFAYVADLDHGLFVIDISDINNPYILGWYEMDTEPTSLFNYGSYAFLTDAEGLKIIQIKP
jgi:hypothetical protein